jgi:hypothetical protein
MTLVLLDRNRERCRQFHYGTSTEPSQVGTAGDVSGTGRAPLGFGSRKFRRSDATSLPSGSTWPCSLDRATVWPSACSRRRVFEIRQRGASCVLAEGPIELLQEMRLDGLRSRKRSATRKIVDKVPRHLPSVNQAERSRRLQHQQSGPPPQLELRPTDRPRRYSPDEGPPRV